jgi:hypothetical protein
MVQNEHGKQKVIVPANMPFWEMPYGHLPGLHRATLRRFFDDQHLPNSKIPSADDTWVEGFVQLINSPEDQTNSSGTAQPSDAGTSPVVTDTTAIAGSAADSMDSDDWSVG